MHSIIHVQQISENLRLFLLLSLNLRGPGRFYVVSKKNVQSYFYLPYASILLCDIFFYSNLMFILIKKLYKGCQGMTNFTKMRFWRHRKIKFDFQTKTNNNYSVLTQFLYNVCGTLHFFSDFQNFSLQPSEEFRVLTLCKVGRVVETYDAYTLFHKIYRL